MKRLRRFGALCAFMLLFVPSAASAGIHVQSIWRNVGGDFGAFYCSGSVALSGQNPYLVEPLRSCENEHQPLKGRSDRVVDPSPLPGYDLAFFGLLARLPYASAKLLWYAILFGSLLITAVALARLTKLPLPFVFMSIALVDGALNFTYGQLPPVVVAALTVGAYFLERQRYGVAAIAASAAMLEPHLGLPACIAMFIWFPRCRVAFGVVGCALLAASLTTGGVAQTLAYFTTYLPVHAQSELVANDQFSLSSLLHVARLSDRLALMLGTLSYLIMTCIGVWLGHYAARALRSDAFVVLLPPAAILVGGSFIHDIQFAVALPAALLLCSKTRPRVLPWIALGLLAFPWYSYSGGWFSFGIAVRVTGLIVTGSIAAIALSARPPTARRTGIVLSMVAFLGLLFTFTHLPGPRSEPQIAAPSAIISGKILASENWGAYLRATPSLVTPSFDDVARKMPTWLGTLLLLAAALRLRSPSAAGATPSVRSRTSLDVRPAQFANDVARERLGVAFVRVPPETLAP